MAPEQARGKPVDTPGRSYDVSDDGTRLLVLERATADVRHRIEFVLNWQQPPRDHAASR